jgi:hypothetical protein
MAITNGGILNSVPATGQQALSSNYLDLASTAGAGWAQQYVPDLMEKEAEVFGPRTISGFLAQVGAEEAMTADQVVWSEQSRLHLSYKGVVTTKAGGTVVSGGLIEIQTDIDGNDIGTDHGIRVNDTVIIAGSAGVVKCLVTEAIRGTTGGTHDKVEVAPYGVASLDAAGFNDADAITVFVYGSEFQKATGYSPATDVATAGATLNSRTANQPSFKSFTNKPIIMKDYYEVSGSDASRIGWVEVSTEAGQSGYLWYLKAEADTRARFTDYIEMAMLEAEVGGIADNGSVSGLVSVEDLTEDAFSADGDVRTGTEGLFAAITNRGNVTSGVTGVNAATDLAEFDAILAEFDKQGAIEEYMMFVNRSTSLAIDDMLASMNSYGAGGTSYGVFNNSEDMALNLGFTGFRRGSYDFYKSDFRYLNDLSTRGGINAAAGSNAIRGVMIPAGTSSVYDQTVGQSMKRPFLHVRYRASQTDDRRMKTWVTGSVGAATSALDAMQLHFLTERCLITQGANNFMLMK